jgi:hypothetical protein
MNRSVIVTSEMPTSVRESIPLRISCDQVKNAIRWTTLTFSDSSSMFIEFYDRIGGSNERKQVIAARRSLVWPTPVHSRFMPPPLSRVKMASPTRGMPLRAW